MKGLPPAALACCLLAVSAVADADDLYSGARTYLDLAHYRLAFQYPDGDHEGHIGKLGVAYDVPLGGGVSGGLHGGYATLDVDGEPQPVPLSFGGRYLGLNLGYEGTEGDYLNLFGEFAYTWHDVNGDSLSAPSSEAVWYESWVALGPVLRWQRLRIYAGGYYQYLQGSQTESRAVRELDFHSDRRAGGYLGLSVYLDRDNTLGVYVTGGAREAVSLVFSREF